MRTKDLFSGTAFSKPKRKRRRLAHFCDVGNVQCGDAEDLGKPLAEMLCPRCGWKSDWLIFENDSEVKRGIPCPICNAEKQCDCQA
jgi:hypothetical protein